MNEEFGKIFRLENSIDDDISEMMEKLAVDHEAASLIITATRKGEEIDVGVHCISEEILRDMLKLAVNYKNMLDEKEKNNAN